MKKSVLAICGLLMSTGLVLGQTFETSNVQSWTGGTPSDMLLTAHASVKNVSGGSLSTAVQYNEVSLVSGADHYFCWAVCYTPGAVTDGFVSPHPIELADDEISHVFYADYLPQGTSGISTLEYCFLNANDTTQKSCFQMVFDTENVGVEDAQTLIVLSAYPNPASDELTISYQFANDIKNPTIEIYDMLGSKVKSVKLEDLAGKQVIDTSVLPSGMYFYKMASASMDLGLRKFMVAH